MEIIIMKKIYKYTHSKLFKLARKILSFVYLKKVQLECKSYKHPLKVNAKSSVNSNTIINENVNFNVMSIRDDGDVYIGSNFHSGKDCMIMTQVHNYNKGATIPYDKTYIYKNVLIEDNVWLGDKVIIIGDWEQDWHIKGRFCRGVDEDGRWLYPWSGWSPWYSTSCITDMVDDGHTYDEAYTACGNLLIEGRTQYVIDHIERRQRGVQRARREFPHARLQLLHAVTVSHGPWNVHPDDPGIITVTELIPILDPQPDLIGLSFWGTNAPITDALDWIQGITKYPRMRFFIDELGARSDADQATRIQTETNLARCWGANLVSIWMMYQTWCGEVRPNGSHRYEGIFYQAQPCAGKVIFDVIITEEDLDLLLTRVPQIQVMDAWKDTGLRVGLRLDKTDPENPVITGSHTHTPNPSMASGLKDKINYDANGNQVGTTPRVFADDDTHNFAGWAKKDTVN